MSKYLAFGLLILPALALGQFYQGNAGSQQSLTCPTPSTCPAGYTGSVCEFVVCPQKGNIINGTNPNMYHVDRMSFASCGGSYAIPVDSHIQSLTLVVSSSANVCPNVTVLDPTGNPVNVGPTGGCVTWTGVLNNPSMFGTYTLVIQPAASGSCSYEAHANTDMTLALGYVQGYNYQTLDSPSSTLTEYQVGAIVATVQGLGRPGFSAMLSTYSVQNNSSQLIGQYPIIERFQCANDILAGPLTCTTANPWDFKLSGIDENGFQFLRTNTLQCTASSG